MSNILPFKKKVQSPKVPNSPRISMDGCNFEENGIGMLLGDGVDVEMKDTTFKRNGVGIVAGDLDEQFLHILKSATAPERFKFAQELGDISKVQEPSEITELILKSTLGQKLTNIASVATVSTWLSNIIQGASTIELDQLILTIMGG
tara:strand:+ start:1874 stop:2314 length:441 start_codon:yes stop_codon:yes gene_type:complete